MNVYTSLRAAPIRVTNSDYSNKVIVPITTLAGDSCEKVEITSVSMVPANEMKDLFGTVATNVIPEVCTIDSYPVEVDTLMVSAQLITPAVGQSIPQLLSIAFNLNAACSFTEIDEASVGLSFKINGNGETVNNSSLHFDHLNDVCKVIYNHPTPLVNNDQITDIIITGYSKVQHAPGTPQAQIPPKPNQCGSFCGGQRWHPELLSRI